MIAWKRFLISAIVCLFCQKINNVWAFTLVRAPTLGKLSRSVHSGKRIKPSIVPAESKGSTPSGARNSIIESSLWGTSRQRSNSADGNGFRIRVRRLFTQVRKRLRNFFLRGTIVLVLATTILQSLFPFGGTLLFRPEPARASAPIMALPKAEDLDPGTEAIKRHEKEMAKKTQLELDELARKAREIESKEGAAARNRFEKEYKAKEQEKAQKKAEGFEQLKRDLLDQGIDPFCDIEGQRQVILYDKGLDMGEVSGTPFNLEQDQQKRSPKKSFNVRKAPNREIVKLMVEDLKARDMDPLEYFASHKDQTMSILELPAPRAMEMVELYKANLQEYGQITKPQPGEMSVKEKKEQAELKAKMDPKAQKELARQKKTEEKARAKAERDEARAKAKAERERAKAEAKAEKERQKAEAKAAKEEAKLKEKEEKEDTGGSGAAAAGAAAAAAGVGVGAAGAAGSAGSAISNAIPDSTPSEQVDSSGADGGSFAGDNDDLPTPNLPAPSTRSPSSVSSNELQKKLVKIIPASVVVVGLGAGAYGFNVYRKRAAEEEEERQRQFRMLMQGTQPEDSGSEDSEDFDKPNDSPQSKKERTSSSPSAESNTAPAPAPAAPPKKRRLGIFKSKKGGGRETDLNVLVSSDAQAPEFARLLGKILTFGAPGRFPNSQAILGNELPMDDFDLDKAKEMLIEARKESDLEVAQSAEIFANVVNCMLIEIMDLASSSLGEKESKNTVDAINIVVDFMNHAASLYDAVAEGATIAPVTYSGSLSRSKLEQMFSQYAVGGMMNMDSVGGDFDSRVALLQDVLAIGEKKAEGLMLKAMQKNMAEMMKNGGEGMEEMMKNMGGEGMFGADGAADMDLNQIKAMLTEFKAAKDRGEYSKEELEEVRKKFKELFGSSLDDVFNDATDSTEEEREVMELMKSVLED